MSVALDIQHAQRMRRIIVSSVDCLSLHYFSTLLLKSHNFRIQVIQQKNVCCDFFLQAFFETSLILGRTERDTVKNVCRFKCEVPLILVIF